MAFANGTNTLYFPVAGSAGASQWGSDVRKMLSAADAGADGTTVCNLGTGGTVTRTADPYTTSTADLAQADYGWAVTPTDMGSVDGAKRFYPAGTFTFTFYTTPSAVFTTETKNLLAYVYRVGPAPGRTRTLIASGTGVMGLGAGAVTVSVATPEIVLEPDETLQFSAEMSAGGLVAVGRTVQFFTGTQAGTQVRVDTPNLGTLADTTGSATGAGTAAGSISNVLNMTGTAAGSGAAVGAMGATAATTGSASGASAASGLGSSVAGTIGTADGSANVVGLASKVLGTVGTVNIGEGGSGGSVTSVYPVFVSGE